MSRECGDFVALVGWSARGVREAPWWRGRFEVVEIPSSSAPHHFLANFASSNLGNSNSVTDARNGERRSLCGGRGVAAALPCVHILISIRVTVKPTGFTT